MYYILQVTKPNQNHAGFQKLIHKKPCAKTSKHYIREVKAVMYNTVASRMMTVFMKQNRSLVQESKLLHYSYSSRC